MTMCRMSELIVFAFEVCCEQTSAKQRSTYVALEWPDLTGRRVSGQDCSAGVLGSHGSHGSTTWLSK